MWKTIREALTVSLFFLGLFCVGLVAVFGDQVNEKQYLFDLGLRLIRFAALPAVFPI